MNGIYATLVSVTLAMLKFIVGSMATQEKNFGATPSIATSGSKLTDMQTRSSFSDALQKEKISDDEVDSASICPNVTCSVRELSIKLYEKQWINTRAFTPCQFDVLNMLRERVINMNIMDKSLDNFHFYSRFCEARDWDLDTALKMLINHLSWRIENGLHECIFFDNTARKGSKFLLEYAEDASFCSTQAISFQKFHKVDKFGRPVAYYQLGKFDPEKVKNTSCYESLKKLFVWDQEFTLEYRLPAASIGAQKLISESLNIIDLKGLRLQIFDAEARKLLKDIADIGTNHYPQTMGAIYIVNAPFFFRIIWAFLNPLLPQRVKEVIYVFGGSEVYLPHLLEVIEYENLPSFLGGQDENYDSKQEVGPWSNYIPSKLAHIFSMR